MKNIILILIVCVSLVNCTKDVTVSIISFDFEPLSDYYSYSGSTEFLDSVLVFNAIFHTDYEPCAGCWLGPYIGDVIYLNSFDENNYSITSDSHMILKDDTLKIGEKLNDIFEYVKIESPYSGIQDYAYNFRSITKLYNNDGYYKFYLRAYLSDSTLVSDSCLVKINF